MFFFPSPLFAKAASATLGNSHLYWRLLVTANTGSEVIIKEVEFRGSVGGATLVPTCTTYNMGALGQVIWSTDGTTTPAWRAFDGTAAEWDSLNVAPAWVGFIFPSAVDVKEFAFTTFFNSGFQPTALKLQCSDDGVTWYDRRALTGLTTTASTQYVYASPSGPATFSVAPTVTTDTGFFGVGDVATVTYSNNGSSSTIVWLRDGSPISGATSASYTYVSGDVGHTVAAQVTATSFDAIAAPTVATSSGNSIVTPTFTTDTRVPAGDMQSGSDSRLTAGDMQSGTDLRITTTRTA